MADSSEDESSESSCDEEELEWEYEEAVNEVVDLQAELRAAEAETKQLRMRLQAATSQSARTGRPAGPALGPGALAALPAAHSGAEQRRIADMRTLLEWLSQHVQLGPEHPAEVLDVGFEVPIGGRTVHLRRVAQWAMPTAPGGRLRLSVPVEHQESVAQLIAYIKACGGRADPEAARRFAAVWDLVPGELATGFTLASGSAAVATTRCTGAAAACTPEPSVLLAHRGCTQGILVANWPTREAIEAFGASATSAARAVGAAAALPCAAGALATSALGRESAAADAFVGGAVALTVGARVEVEYEGRWYSGTFQGIDGEGKATIRCDIDPDGVLTVAPLCRLRRLSGGVGAGPAAVAGAGACASGSDGAAGLTAGMSPAAAAVATPAGASSNLAVATTARAIPVPAGQAVGEVAAAAALHTGRRFLGGTDSAAVDETLDASLSRPSGHRRTRSSAL